jgi:prepilin-type N-terminal cleavage/methylation domain-containing protein
MNLSRRTSRRGYTIVEVMSAMTLFAIGAAGVIGMQTVTIQGGADARNFDTATGIAREWQARLQRDALSWAAPTGDGVASADLSKTLWLKSIQDPPAWQAPTAQPTLAGYSAAFDILGRDVEPTSTDRVFCVHHRLAWIANGNAGAVTAIMRAEIRVVWSRLEAAPPTCDNVNVGGDADAGAGAGAGATDSNLHTLTVTTAIRRNPAP